MNSDVALVFGQSSDTKFKVNSAKRRSHSDQIDFAPVVGGDYLVRVIGSMCRSFWSRSPPTNVLRSQLHCSDSKLVLWFDRTRGLRACIRSIRVDGCSRVVLDTRFTIWLKRREIDLLAKFLDTRFDLFSDGYYFFLRSLHYAIRRLSGSREF
jgi:hypothetical protein